MENTEIKIGDIVIRRRYYNQVPEGYQVMKITPKMYMINHLNPIITDIKYHPNSEKTILIKFNKDDFIYNVSTYISKKNVDKYHIGNTVQVICEQSKDDHCR